MKKSINFSLIFIIVNSTFLFPQNSLDFDYFFKKYPKENRERFEKEILKFEEIDKKTSYDDNSIMFIGSSSIRLWDKLEDVMDPLKIIKRGYGGAHYRDLIFFIDRILNNHSLSMIVCFVANDIKGLEDIYNIGGERDGSIEEIINLYDFLVNQIRKKYPHIPIIQIEITPTSSRWKYWKKISDLNKSIKDYCNKNYNMHYIETKDFFLNKNGTPNNNLFRRDLLHLNDEGYNIWNKIVKEKLLSIKN